MKILLNLDIWLRPAFNVFLCPIIFHYLINEEIQTEQNLPNLNQGIKLTVRTTSQVLSYNNLYDPFHFIFKKIIDTKLIAVWSEIVANSNTRVFFSLLYNFSLFIMSFSEIPMITIFKTKYHIFYWLKNCLF